MPTKADRARIILNKAGYRRCVHFLPYTTQERTTFDKIDKISLTGWEQGILNDEIVTDPSKTPYLKVSGLIMAYRNAFVGIERITLLVSDHGYLPVWTLGGMEFTTTSPSLRVYLHQGDKRAIEAAVKEWIAQGCPEEPCK